MGECDEESACQSSIISAVNAKELQCKGYRSCYEGQFSLSCTEDESCEIECEGDDACRGSTISADYVKELQCKDEKACTDATIAINSVADDFGIECGDGGCANLDVTINAMGDLGEIKCSGDGACVGASFTFVNSGTAAVSIETIDCDGEDACKDATFTFSGSFNVDECKCGDVGEDFGCDGTTGLTTSICGKGGIDPVITYAAAAIADNADVIDDKTVQDEDAYSYTISLSKNALLNLWLLVAVCLVSNLIVFYCCYRGSNKNVTFDSKEANDRYVSDQ